MAVFTPVTRESLYQNFQLIQSDIVRNQKTLIVGPDYAVRNYNITAGDGLIGNYTGVASLVAGWPNLVLGEVVDVATIDVVFSNALVNYAPMTVTGNAAAYGVSTHKLRYQQSPGVYTVWQGTGFSAAPPSPTPIEVEVGDYVKLYDGTLTLNTKVAAIESDGTGLKVLVLEDNFPAGFVSAVFNLSLSEIVEEEAVPVASIVAAASTITVSLGAQLTTARTVTAKAVIGGTIDGVAGSRVFVGYRAYRAVNSTQVRSISSTAELATHFVGYDDPDSELGFAVARALAPTLTATPSNVASVLFISLPTNDLVGYQTVNELVVWREDYTQFVPLTQDTGIISWLDTNLLAVREAQALQRPTEMYIALPITDYDAKMLLKVGGGNLAGTAALVGADVTVTAGAGSDTFIVSGVQPGDEFRIITSAPASAQGVFTVLSVTTNAELILSAAPTGLPATISKFEIWHPLSTSEKIVDLGSRSAAYADRNILSVFPPTMYWDGVAIESWHLPAALAGSRGFTAPQQPLTSMQLEAGWATPSSNYLFNGYLKTLADYGVMVVGPTHDFLAAMVDYPYTTNQASVEVGREQVVATVNCLRGWLTDTINLIRGRYAVVSPAFDSMRADILEAMQELQNGSTLPNFGPMILNWTITQFYQDPNQADAVILAMTVTVPIGVDAVTINLTVTI